MEGRSAEFRRGLSGEAIVGSRRYVDRVEE